jgi:hypothetical protein
LYQVLYYLNPVNRWWSAELPDLRYSFVAGGAIFLSYIIRREKYSENRVFDIHTVKWMLAIMVMMGIVSTYAADPTKHNAMLSLFIKRVIFVIIAYKVIDSPKKFEYMIFAFLIGSFYVGWVGHEAGRTFQFRLEDIGMADGTDSNDTGAGLIAAVPVLLFYVINGKYWQKFLALFFMAFILDTIVLVNSRGAFLGLAVSCTYMLVRYYFCRLKEPGLRTKIVIMFCAFGILFIYLTDDAFWRRMSSLAGVVDKGTSLDQRTHYWMKTFELVEKHPFGVGYGGYVYHSPYLLEPEMLGVKGKRAVHSMYFQSLADLGYIGPVLLFGYLMSSFILFNKIEKKMYEKNDIYLFHKIVAIKSGYIAFLLAALFLDRLYAELLYWFPMFAACFWNIFIHHKKHEEIDEIIEDDKQIARVVKNE